MSELNTTITEAHLRERWPAAFNNARKPLKLGINSDMGLVGRCDALARWTRHPVYLRNIIAGGERVDIDGAAAGEVREVEQAHAWEKLVMLRAKIALARERRQRPWEHPWNRDLPRKASERREYLREMFPSGLSLADESAEMRLRMPKRNGPRWHEYGWTRAID